VRKVGIGFKNFAPPPFHFVHIFITFATVVEEALKKGESTTQLQAHLFCAKINVDGALVGQVREALVELGQKMQKFTSPLFCA